MSETNETEDKTARGGRKMTLNVRRTVESGHVRQSFSHGRSKSVLVEKKKRRAIGAGGAAQAVEEPAAPKPAPRTAETVQKPVQDDTPARQARVVLPQLSEEEKDARMRALADSRQRDAAEREKAKETAALNVVTEDQRAQERKEAEERKRKEDERHQAEAKARKVGEETARKHLPKEEAEEAPRTADARHKKSVTAPRRGEERRVRGRLTITNALDEEQRQRSLASLKRRQERQKKQITGPQAQAKIQREVVIPEVITIQELANRMAERGVDVIKYLMKDGAMHKITDVIDSDTAQLVAEEFGHMRASRLGGRRRGRLHRRGGSRRGFAAARADRHHHGPCRSRQDLAARRHPHDQCGFAGSRRHHPAYRRLSGGDAARPTRSLSSTRLATRPSPPCGSVALR